MFEGSCHRAPHGNEPITETSLIQNRQDAPQRSVPLHSPRMVLTKQAAHMGEYVFQSRYHYRFSTFDVHLQKIHTLFTQQHLLQIDAGHDSPSRAFLDVPPIGAIRSKIYPLRVRPNRGVMQDNVFQEIVSR